MSIEVAIYTDVTTEESVDGVDGFNFQSVSPGIDGTRRRRIREVMLHRSDPHWPQDRPETDQPQTAAFSRNDGDYTFSRGLSTGTTANGRRGNQLTQAIVTADRADLEPYRPAQILGAEEWKLEKAPSKKSEPWTTPVQVRPEFEAEELLKLLEDPWASRILPEYLTMLEQAVAENPTKCVLVHDDMDTVLQWMALGTLLIGIEEAYDLELRAFVQDPFLDSAPLVGLHSENTHAQVHGANVVDLLGKHLSDIEVSASAKKVAEWTQTLDSFDLFDVVSVARRWMPVVGVERGSFGAEVVVGTRDAEMGREEWDLAVSLIEGLATPATVDDLHTYFDEFADAVSAYRLVGEGDARRAASAARRSLENGQVEMAEAITFPAVEWIAGDPKMIAAWASELSSVDGLTWPQTENRARLSEQVFNMIELSNGFELDPLLSVAKMLPRGGNEGVLTLAFDRVIRQFLDYPDKLHAGIGKWVAPDLAADRIGAIFISICANPEDPRHATLGNQILQGKWQFLPEALVRLGIDNAQVNKCIAAVELSSIEPSRRREAIRAREGSLDPRLWTIALQGTSPGTDPQVWSQWALSAGVRRDFAQKASVSIQQQLRVDPSSMRIKDVKPLQELMHTLVAEDGSLSQLSSAFDDYIDKVPTSISRMRDFVGGAVAKIGRSQDSDEGDDSDRRADRKKTKR